MVIYVSDFKVHVPAKKNFGVDTWKWYKIYLETLKKSSQNFAIFWGPNFWWHKIFLFLKQDFAKMVHFSENVFSWIYKYLNGQVLCVQFFDFRFRLDFSWGLFFVTFSLNTGPKKSRNGNENQKTVHNTWPLRYL